MQRWHMREPMRRRSYVNFSAVLAVTVTCLSSSGVFASVHSSHMLAGLDIGFGVWLPAGRHTETSGSVLTGQTNPSGSSKYHGQDHEDLYAYQTFFNKTDKGTYLEMGALDGITLSNTLFFAEEAGWSGILIEPNTASFDKLVQNRRTDTCVNVAICDVETQVHFIASQDPAVAGILEFMPESFIKQWHPNTEVSKLPMVPCLPLSKVLHKLKFAHIDFFSLDVEGAELRVLSTLDFSAISIDVMVVEADHHDAQKNAEVRRLLSNAGFMLHGHVARNDWFVHKSFDQHAMNHK